LYQVVAHYVSMICIFLGFEIEMEIGLVSWMEKVYVILGDEEKDYASMTFFLVNETYVPRISETFDGQGNEICDEGVT